MKSNFDKLIDRRGGDSKKWAKYQGRDIIPMWVADTDFEAPPEVIEAVKARVNEGVFGYVWVTEACEQAVKAALLKDYDWKVNREELTWLPSAGVGLHLVCRALLSDEEAAVMATPIYPPFLEVPVFAERAALHVPLKNNNGRWEWDFEALEQSLSTSAKRPRLLYLSNPHNPVGRAWTRNELEQLLDVVVRYDLLVCSDEVHCDLILEPGLKHIPFATLSEEAADRTVTLMSPSKTYNLAGMGCGFAITHNQAIKVRLRNAMRGIAPVSSILGFVACEAAYRYGADYRDALINYLRANRDRVVEVLGACKGLKVFKPEATFLAWIDASEIEDPVQFFENAGVGLYDGALFGAPGYLRLNFGCPRATLDAALERMTKALR